MNRTTLPAFLNIGTLLIVLIVIVGALVWFLRKRSNRKPLEDKQERNIAADLDRGRATPRELPPE